MLGEDMDKRKKIDKAARAFLQAVINGMNNRPPEFPSDIEVNYRRLFPPQKINENS
jgi:hypothetical protein